MPFAYHYVLLIMWIAWALYWWALAFNVKTAAKRESLASQFAHVAPLAVGGLEGTCCLLAVGADGRIGEDRHY